MGNFEKLSVLVIVVIIVMILVVAIHTWNSDGDEGTGEPLASEKGYTPAKAVDEDWPIEIFDNGDEKEGARTAPEVIGPGIGEPKIGEPEIVAPRIGEPEIVAPRIGEPEVVEPDVVRPVEPDPPAPADDGGPWVYTVKGGDTISQICERELGTWRRQKEVFALNPGLDPLSLRAGDKLKMPARGRASSVKVPGAAPAAAVVRGGTGSIKLGDWYVLRHGDRMSNIAKRAYGSIDRWPELWARNLSVVKDPDDVQPGTRIFIPK